MEALVLYSPFFPSNTPWAFSSSRLYEKNINSAGGCNMSLNAYEKTLKNGGKDFERFFLDVIDENVPRFAIRARIKQYIEYYQSQEWDEHGKGEDSFPTILIICPNDKTKDFLKRFVSKTLEDEYIYMTFSLTTKQLFKGYKENKHIWVVALSI